MRKNNQKMKSVSFDHVRFSDSFWSVLQTTVSDVTIRSCLDQCRISGRIGNFIKAADEKFRGSGKFRGKFFNDSDVYKVIEGAAYSLINTPDHELECEIDEVITHISNAQEDSGYIMTWYTLNDPDNKWSDMDKHEMYCIGHLIEAGIAYKKATGKTDLYDVSVRAADYLCSLFGPDKKHWVPGHEEIELALIKLYLECGETKYLDLASFLLEERGKGLGIGLSWETAGWGAAYSQDDVPVKDITKVKGHAVRAMYLYTAMADLALLTDNQHYINALDRVWNNITEKNMYVTGGIGPSKDNEGFTEDYDLPNLGAYCETCAAAGMVFWNQRMNLLHREGKYIDILEKSLYNGLIAGLSQSGNQFFYENPLESNGDHHRSEWYKVSCCPTQLARMVPSIGNYLYATKGSDLFINLYSAGFSSVPMPAGPIEIRQETEYPWEGNIRIRIEKGLEHLSKIFIRIPGWCPSFTLRLNKQVFSNLTVAKGYLEIENELINTFMLDNTFEIDIDFDMTPQLWKAHDNVRVNKGMIALSRGPLIYCFEECDNKHSYDSINLSFQLFNSSDIKVDEQYLFRQYVRRLILENNENKYVAIPYFLWDNREEGRMRIWIPLENSDKGDVKEDENSQLYQIV